jgi:hypothetical protein
VKGKYVYIKVINNRSKLYENVGFEAIHSRNNGDISRNNTLEIERVLIM